MNATVLKPGESPGWIAAMVAGVGVSVLWQRNHWTHADIAPFIAFSLVQTHWQFRRLIAFRPSRGLPLALVVSAIMSGVWYVVARLL